jgi:hypothetical protein
MIFMSLEYLSSDDEPGSAFFSRDQEGYLGVVMVQIEQDSILPEESQLALGERIGSERFHVASLRRGIRCQQLLCLPENQTAILTPEPAKIVDDRGFYYDGPPHDAVIIGQTRIIVNPVEAQTDRPPPAFFQEPSV